MTHTITIELTDEQMQALAQTAYDPIEFVDNMVKARADFEIHQAAEKGIDLAKEPTAKQRQDQMTADEAERQAQADKARAAALQAETEAAAAKAAADEAAFIQRVADEVARQLAAKK